MHVKKQIFSLPHRFEFIQNISVYLKDLCLQRFQFTFVKNFSLHLKIQFYRFQFTLVKDFGLYFRRFQFTLLNIPAYIIKIFQFTLSKYFPGRMYIDRQYFPGQS